MTFRRFVSNTYVYAVMPDIATLDEPVDADVVAEVPTPIAASTDATPIATSADTSAEVPTPVDASADATPIAASADTSAEVPTPVDASADAPDATPVDTSADGPTDDASADGPTDGPAKPKARRSKKSTVEV